MPSETKGEKHTSRYAHTFVYVHKYIYIYVKEKYRICKHIPAYACIYKRMHAYACIGMQRSSNPAPTQTHRRKRYRYWEGGPGSPNQTYTHMHIIYTHCASAQACRKAYSKVITLSFECQVVALMFHVFSLMFLSSF